MNIDKIFENNEKWGQTKLDLKPTYFQDLAKGQSPELLYIGCSDSRVVAEGLMGLGPGDVFVHRNIANMVPNTDLNVMSVIEYAVVHLKVNHVAVCGHYGCGGVKAAMQSTDLGLLNSWLRNIKDTYRLHKTELDKIENEDKRYNSLIELNVQEQCVNLLKMVSVQKAIRERNLLIHGWVFDISTGKLIDLNIDFENILSDIRKIYHFD